MTATAALTTDLRKQVLLLEDDLRERLEGDPALKRRWADEHRTAVDRGRTASAWATWRDDRVTQAAAGWVLTTVFIRFCEDNSLVGPVWIAGPEHRRQEALDAQLAYFRREPEHTDREWLQQSVDHLAGMAATAELVGQHAALRLVTPSGQAASELLAFWRLRGDDGGLLHDLADPELGTRFLGDLYQDLSDYAKATFALLQTPVFVEEFILDRTMEPALAERPLDGFRAIDPACGSGHFLLGMFERLLDRWQTQEPATERQALVQKALDTVHGVDLNPFAVAIARFRLTIAALKACGLLSLQGAPAFRFHLAVGDSLLHGDDQLGLDLGVGYDLDAALSGFAYATEDLDLLRGILRNGSYDVVVGNPPYITVKDATLNKAYRDRYASCKGKYAMTVPFIERFFQLARPGTGDQPAGWVGQITSNSFMKREFGKKLIEEYLVHQELKLIVDSEGAWIPGHNSDGTPTVILVGRNQRPSGSTVRAILSKGRRETRAAGDDGSGPYWSSLVAHIDDPGWEDTWVSIVDMDSAILSRHPWSLSGGGAPEVLTILQSQDAVLSSVVARIGFFGILGADDAMIVDEPYATRRNLEQEATAALVVGDEVRDFETRDSSLTWFPYDERHELRQLDHYPEWGRHLWSLRVDLGARATFSGGSYVGNGRPFYEWHQLPKDLDAHPWALAFAEVATHNHFALDRESKAFKQTAPVVKLPRTATEDDHLALLALLNSSTVCFWLKQRCKPKGGAAGSAWARTFQYNGRNVEECPLPPQLPVSSGRRLDELSRRMVRQTPFAVVDGGLATEPALRTAKAKASELLSDMIAAQEELDWEVYRLYGLVSDDLTNSDAEVPGLALGERAFEVALARDVASGVEETTWFSEHSSTPITEIPTHWPENYRRVVEKRLELIATNATIRLLERPENKRRWARPSWEDEQEIALRGWLLDRIEKLSFWFDGQGRPTPRSIASLADIVERDVDLHSVLKLWEGRPDVSVSDSLVRLLADEGVPFLAAYRYKESGLRKRTSWEEAWALQRREDVGHRESPLLVPPKYEAGDFRRESFWKARGKLDVPKERFVLYLDAGRETDPTPLLGWAGWDHAQQSLALSLVIGEREAEGWEDERLVPLVAGLAELQPWVEQWHSNVDPTYGVSLAAFCREQLDARAAQVGMTPSELAQWRPAASTRGRRPRVTS